MSTATVDRAATARGAIRVRERVVEKVARQASAIAMGVPRSSVDVQVADWAGGLAVRVATALPIPDLDDTEAVRAERPIVERVREAQSVLAEELSRLTGREVRRVSVTVTGAVIPERKRVT
ncbi:MAG: NTP pyrophosphohydrolase [Microbacterium sp.]